jgi:hypothetical protein
MEVTLPIKFVFHYSWPAISYSVVCVTPGAIGLSSGEKERELQLLKFALDLIWLYPFTLGNIATCYLQNCSAKLGIPGLLVLSWIFWTPLRFVIAALTTILFSSSIK